MNMKPNSDDSKSLEITGDSKPKVPSFSCIVYVRKDEDGTVHGRVANLDGIQASGVSERFVLGKVTTEFKTQIVKYLEQGQEIPWIDPRKPILENEKMRWVPLHL